MGYISPVSLTAERISICLWLCKMLECDVYGWQQLYADFHEKYNHENELVSTAYPNARTMLNFALQIHPAGACRPRDDRTFLLQYSELAHQEP